jgi:hypothetical protein
MKKLLMTTCTALGCGFFVLAAQQAAVFTAVQAAAGKVAFEKTCADCHTDSLIPPAGSNVPPLAGATFLTKWGVRTTKDLSDRIKLATGPDDQDKSLILMAYILQFNGARPGTQELTPATTVEIRSIVKDN